MRNILTPILAFNPCFSNRHAMISRLFLCGFGYNSRPRIFLCVSYSMPVTDVGYTAIR